jgi:hypothetical protein
MAHQLSTDAVRLPTSLMSSGSTYGLSSSMSYHSSLLSLPTSSSAHHQLVQSPVSATVATYQQQSISTHQLPPTPNSLVTMIGPNSGSSNSASDQLTTAELTISSVSPVQQHQQQQHQHQQQQQQQGSSGTSWNSLPLGSENSGGPRLSLPSPPPLSGAPSLPSGMQQAAAVAAAAHLHSAHQHQAFANHYNQSFQQPRPPPHQPFYNWYN